MARKKDIVEDKFIYENQFLSSYRDLLKQASEFLRPPENLSTSEWADAFSILSSEDSARPGKWVTEEFEYQREIMDAFDDPNIKGVVWMANTQMGKTSVMRNCIGKKIDLEPGPMMLVQPTLDMAETFSKDRLSPFLRDTKRLSRLIKDNRARDSGNTLLHKKFPGGFIVMSGANSAASLKSRPIRDLYEDEVDTYPLELDGDGDPSDLAARRTDEFWNAKSFKVSSPTDKNSRIHAAYEQSDKRLYFLTCPECGSKITFMDFKKLKWKIDFGEPDIPGQKRTVRPEHISEIYYECPENGCKINEKYKKTMVRNGKWIAQNPGGNIAGFWINALYKPYGSWLSIIVNYENVRYDQSKYRVFKNTILAQIFEDFGDAPDYLHLYAKREFYKIGIIPSADTVFLTGAADVQKDRFEIEVKGWAQDQQSHSIEKLILMCDTAKLESYDLLDDFLRRQYLHPSGKFLKVRGFAIDTGYNTQVVYTWVRRQELGRVFAIKGVSVPRAINKPIQVDIDFMGQKIANGVTVWGVGVSILKSELYARLRLSKNEDGTFPFGFCHFPDYPEDYFRQLVSESLSIKIVNGIKRFLWNKIYERNEMLDLSVYNRAMSLILGIDNLSESEWQRAREQLFEPAKKTEQENQNQKIRWQLSRGITLD
jgi:phage terminase large subunit GpA-like protein